ncbi:MAG: sigma 54-interacting transcriptional regulator [Sediminicola sp.]
MKDKMQDALIKGRLMDQLPHEMVWLDGQGNIINANAKFCSALGYSKKDCETLSITDINITVTPESWKKHWEEVHKNGSVHFTAIHKTKKGKFYEVEVHAQSFSFDGKKYICAILHELGESGFHKKLIEGTQSMANLGGWELNLYDGSILATPCALEIFNTKNPSDLVPANAVHRFKESDRYRSLLGEVIRNGTALDEILETNDSPPHYIRAVARPIMKGDKIYKILGAYQDVTEIKDRESDLDLLKTVIDNAQDLIYVYNDKGELLHYSGSLIEKLGYSAKELDQMSMFDLDPAVTDEFYSAHFELLRAKGSHRFEWLITRKDGTMFPVDITSSHLVYKGEDYCCSVVRDITAKKMHDLQIYEALEEIKSLKERLEIENEYLQEEIGSKINFKNIICKSDSYKSVLIQVDQVAPTETTVLITGESGTGKELLARAIHSNSKRKDRPLININCAVLPKELIESELFGHKRGAFTGAFADKVGKFTLADGGTIFLDEIGELPVDLQPKLLRVLQEMEFEELGGTRTKKVDVRIIAATNRDLKEMVGDGRFREDLYYRLNVFPIHNIPLRARKDDIPLLAHFFLEKYAAKAGKAFNRVSKDTLDALMNYNFPGNIRELENMIERAVIVENGPTLKPGNWIPLKDIPASGVGFKSFESVQRDHIIEVLDHTGWRVSGPTGAAKILRMNDKTLFAKMKRLGIEKKFSLKGNP